MPVSKPTPGATGWNVAVDAVIDIANAVEDLPGRVDALEAGGGDVTEAELAAGLATKAAAVHNHAEFITQDNGDNRYILQTNAGTFAPAEATTTALAGKQPLDSDLTALAGLDSAAAGTVASDGAGWVKKTYAQLRTALGLATIATSGKLGDATDVTTTGAAVDSLLAPTEFSGSVVTAWGPISGSAMLRPTFQDRAPSLSYLTTFQAGHTWTAAAGQAGTVALNDTTGTVMRGTQSVLITSSGGGNVGGQRAGLQSPTLPVFDMTAKGIRIQFVVEDPTNLLRVTAQVGQDAANGYSVDIGFPAGNTNNVFVPGEIYTVVVDLASANTVGTPTTRSAMTSIKLTVTDNGGGAGSAKVRFLSVALQDRPTATFPNGVITFGFDDGFLDQFTNARAILDRYGYAATCYIIQDLIGANPSATYMGLGQLHQLEDVHGWEIAAHSATIAEHNVTNAFASLTDSQLRTNLEKHKRWLLREGFRGADHFAYPQGLYNAATVEIVEEYFATARTIIQGSLLEEPGGPADIQRMRCVPINAGTSLATLTALVDAAKRERLWLQFYTHRVLATGATGTQIDTTTFSGLVDYVAAADVAVGTVSSVLAPPRS